MRFVLFILALVIAPTTVMAGEVKACGTPTKADMKAMPQDANYCDIYQRQLAYRVENMKQRSLIGERQENYAAPRREALEQYAQDIEKMNAERGVSEASAETSALTDEAMELEMMIASEEDAQNPAKNLNP
jgi:hypothetical protein